MKKTALSPHQKVALREYNEALRQEDRLGGSVFANAFNMRKQEEKTRAAYERCKELGMTYEDGL